MQRVSATLLVDVCYHSHIVCPEKDVAILKEVHQGMNQCQPFEVMYERGGAVGTIIRVLPFPRELCSILWVPHLLSLPFGECHIRKRRGYSREGELKRQSWVTTICRLLCRWHPRPAPQFWKSLFHSNPSSITEMETASIDGSDPPLLNREEISCSSKQEEIRRRSRPLVLVGCAHLLSKSAWYASSRDVTFKPILNLPQQCRPFGKWRR